MTTVVNPPTPSTSSNTTAIAASATSAPHSGPTSPPLTAVQGGSKPINYAAAAGGSVKKLQSPVVSGNPSPSSTPGLGPGGTKSPVNGKPIPPAVPSVIPPTSGGSNAGSNGNTPTTSHSRKSSLANSAWLNQANGIQMPNGQAPRNANIQFGQLPNSGNAPNTSAQSLNTPSANPRANSPQNSPSPVPQPAATGGNTPTTRLPNTGMPNFGQLNDSADRSSGRPNPNPGGPPLAPSGGPGPVIHARRDSNHSQHPDMSALNPGRGPPGPQAGRGRAGNHQLSGNFQNYCSPPFPQPNNFQRVPSQGRSGPGPLQQAQFQGAGPMNPYQNSQQHGRGASRSPGMLPAQMNHGSLPGTPQMQNAQLMHPQMHNTNFASYGQMNPGYPMPDQMYNNPYAPFGPNSGYYPGQYMQTMGQPPPSPQPYPARPFAPPYASGMARTSSAMSMEHSPRPPSSMGNVSTPSFTPAQPVVPSQPLQAPSPSPSPVKKPPPRTSHALKIVDPSTNKPVNITSSSTPPPRSPAPTGTTSAPVIVSSIPNASVRADAKHGRTESRSLQTDAEKKQAAIQAVAQQAAKLQEEEDRKKKAEEERVQREAEEKAREEEARVAKEKEAERLQKEEEERLAREAEEKAAEEARIAKEAEEKAKKEAEDKARAEAEAAAARVAEEKAKAEAAEAAAALASTETDSDSKDTSDKEETSDVTTSSADKLASSLGTMTIADAETSTPSAEMPPPSTKGRSKPTPLNLSVKTTTDQPLPSAQLSALRSAKFIDSLDHIKYPANIMSPNPALNTNAPNGKFKYEKDFLMQFQSVFTEKPDPMWDQKMREIVGDGDSARPQSARPPSSLGRQSSRTMPTPMGGFGMGKNSFGGLDGSRYAAGSRPGMGMGSLGPPFGGGSNFRPAPMVRTNSSNALNQQGGVPQSPRIGSGGSGKSRKGQGKGTAMERQSSNKPEHKEPTGPGAPTINPADVKPLAFSSGGWKPMSRQRVQEPSLTGDDNKLAPDVVQRKVKAALNKMTPEKFDKISDSILEIAAQSKYESDGRTLRQVIQLTFEKATDEPHWASMYAKFCKRMLETMDPEIKDENIKDKNGVIVTGGALFRKYLLNRCQEEFERGWKVNLPQKPEEAEEGTKQSAEVEILSDEYYKAMAAKRRGLGLIQFIGELYKLNMLTERIMHECIKKLLDFGSAIPEEEEIESLTKLLRTVGQPLDASEKSHPSMNMYFERISSMIEKGNLPSRMTFMLMDIRDLRDNKWIGKDTDKGPKTITEIREQAAKDKAAEDAAKASQRSRPSMGRGDARSYSQNFQSNADQWQSKTMDTADLRKLQEKTRRNVSAANPSTFGPTSMFSNRSGSGNRRTSQLGVAANVDSASSSRTATPPVPMASQSIPHANMFSVLQDQTSPSSLNEVHSETGPSPSSSPPTKEASLEKSNE